MALTPRNALPAVVSEGAQAARNPLPVYVIQEGEGEVTARDAFPIYVVDAPAGASSDRDAIPIIIREGAAVQSRDAIPVYIVAGDINPLGPTNTVAPVASGTPQAGETLTTTNGTWTGTGTITYAYQWQLNGSNISGATSSTYAIPGGAIGGSIYRARVTATDDLGSRTASTNTLNIPQATLNALTLSASTFATSAASGTVIGAIVGKTTGSTVSVTDGRVAVSGNNLVVGLTPSTAGEFDVDLTETLAGATNTPRVSSVGLEAQDVEIIGGQAVGAPGEAGTIYEGYRLSDGDDFAATSADDFLTPTNNDGQYMTTRHYGIQSGVPRYLRGSASLGGYEADPWHTGYKNANRGVVPTSYADTIVYGGSTLKLKSRRAIAGEKLIMGDLNGKNNLSSMVHMGRRNMMRAPCLMEMRLRFPYALASWDQWHPTFWIIQSQPGNGYDGLELDCEGFTPALQFNRNTWNNGVGAYGPTLGTTAPVSKTEFRNYVFELVEVSGAWVCRLFEDGALVGSGSPDFGGNTFDPTRPFHLMMTNHILQSGLTQSVFDTAGDAGAEIECDYWRAWAPTTGTYREPLVGSDQLLVDFNTAFSWSLPTPADVWGSGVTSDVIEMIPNEDNSPAQPWVRGLLPPSVTRTGNTLAGTIADQPGRLILARSYTPAQGDGCRPQSLTLCVGPTLRTTLASYVPGDPIDFDLFSFCDFGDLHMGATVSVTGLPSGITYNAATGRLEGTSAAVGDVTATVTLTNAVGQVAVLPFELDEGAAPVTSFSDDFERPNENLEASPNWTRIDGVAGGARIVSGQLQSNAAGGNTAYASPDLGVLDHYIDITFGSLGANNNYYACRLTDSNNWLGFRIASTTSLTVAARVAGTFNGFAEYTPPALVSGDVIRLSITGTTITVSKNGVALTQSGGGSVAEFPPASTRQGVVARAGVFQLANAYAAGPA